jgi:hypothetical protein
MRSAPPSVRFKDALANWRKPASGCSINQGSSLRPSLNFKVWNPWRPVLSLWGNLSPSEPARQNRLRRSARFRSRTFISKLACALQASKHLLSLLDSAPKAARQSLWIGWVHPLSEQSLSPVICTILLNNFGLVKPVLLAAVSGEMKPWPWKQGTSITPNLLLPKGSCDALSSEDDFDWLVLGAERASLALPAGRRPGEFPGSSPKRR